MRSAIKNKLSNTLKGFTLIELLVVVSIIGILATLVAANLNSARSRARDAQRKSDLKNIQTALRLYYNDYGVYPRSTSGDNYIAGCGNITSPSLCSWGSAWVMQSKTYMNTLPEDPLDSQSYQYINNDTDNDTYTLDACLENGSDPQGIPVSGITCPGTLMFQVKQ